MAVPTLAQRHGISQPKALWLAVLNPLGALLLAGAGVASRWLGTPPTDDRRATWALGALVLAANQALDRLERRLLRWRPQGGQTG